MTLNPKITYLRQQLTSLVSLRYFRTAGMAERHLSTGRANPTHTYHTDTTQQDRADVPRVWYDDPEEVAEMKGGSPGVHTSHTTPEGEGGTRAHLGADHESDDMASERGESR